MLIARRHDRLARVLLVSACAMSAAALTGCKEEFSDEAFGVLDLASFYGGTRTDPAANLPREIPTQAGYVGGVPAELYDFGAVPAITNVNGVPTGVRVSPMYFFFNGSGHPLFSRPVRELRDGTDWMKGGKGVRNPNPKDFCAVEGADPVNCKTSNEKEKTERSYPLRTRDLVVDSRRGRADYQRPVIEVIPGDNQPPRRQYTGLWEIVEVTVPDDYDPDSIKHFGTLQRALDSGKFTQRATGKVINCPVIDERTSIPRGITDRRTYRPRVELWYRRKLAYCFLANGWETLGNPEGELYFAGQDEARFDTFDVSRVKVGTGNELFVKVGRAYNPVTFDLDETTGDPKAIKTVTGNTIISERPRRGPNDPRGYTPVRWVFGIPAPIDYEPGTWTTVQDVDVSRALPEPFVIKNLSVRGLATPCSYAPVTTAVGQQCGKAISNSGVVSVDPMGDPACKAISPDNEKSLECNPDTCLCDAPLVPYAASCGPGIGQCDRTGNSFSARGYRCFPPFGGFCHLGCSGADPNTFAADNKGKPPTEQKDSRCKGVPGYICIPSLETCVRFCDQNITAPNQCNAGVTLGDKDIHEGQTCQDFGVAACAWPDSHTPYPYPTPM